VNEQILRQLPSIDELMNAPELARLAKKHDRELVVSAARVVVGELRSRIRRGESPSDDELSVRGMAKAVASRVESRFAPSLRRAVNASGIILHTGLGRAVLPGEAVDAIYSAIQGYCTLAVDIETGQRGHRDSHVSGLLCELTGAEAATIVNNNAAATMIILNTLAKGKEVIVSRGQLVEIGGSFRMPDVMAASGAILREVGTTNKTHLRDYAEAVNENTGAILRVHQSNYRIVGFAEEPGIAELAKLAKEHDLPLIDDLGSGALVDLAQFGLETEPMVRESVKAADIICFSGDKLIGGPQSGIIIGKAAFIERIKKNQLARALRVGKMTVAGMEATLKLFLDRSRLTQRHPLYRMLSAGLAELEERANAVVKKLDSLSKKAEIEVVDGSSQVGSGSVPAESMPTKLLSVRPKKMSADALAGKLRRHDPPIFARLHKDAVLLDFRTIFPEEDALVEKALSELLKK
jgi:L-seryl-tRNA(Ser) seleniumtransferase